MFEIISSFKRLFSTTQKKPPHWHKIILVIVLAVLIGGFAQPVPAHASPNFRAEDVYVTTIAWPPDPICAGTDYDVRFQVILETRDYQNNRIVGTIRTRLGGIKVTAAPQNSTVATLDPTLVSRETSWSLSDYGTLPAGELPFKLHALKAGKATFLFDMERQNGAATFTEEIKVVNCKYKVSMNASDVFTGDGVTIWTYGSLDTQISGDGGELRGSAAFDFVSGFVGPPCRISYTDFQNPTTIIGHLNDNDQLVLDFQYEPGTVNSSVSCLDSGGSGSQEVDLTNTGLASATFPATGGIRMFTITYAGSDAPPGKMIINVQPVSEEAGG